MAFSKDKGRDVTACDGLPLRMPCTPKRSLLHMNRFGGMASPFGGGKVFSEGVNLSPRRGEEIATRLPRGVFMGSYGSGEPHGMVTFGGSLIFARGTGLYATADGVTVHSLGTVSDTRKSFFIFGEKLYIYPDKLYMEKGGMPKPLELDTGVIEKAQFSVNTLRVPAGYSWATLGFGVGDCLQVVNADDSEPAPEGYYRIQRIQGSVATMAQSFPSTYTSNARFLRPMPDLTACCVSGDRVYGIAGRSIHVSAAGSATDFYSYSTGDGSHAVTMTSDTEGDFTALASWQGYMVFFKEDRICKLLGSRADSFTLQDRQAAGISAALADTLCEVGDALYYATAGGVRRYRGQEPEWVCSFGGASAQGGCGGTDGRAYYLALTVGDEARLSLYLPDEEAWYPEDDMAVGAMLCREGRVWMQNGSGVILTASSDGRPPETTYTEENLRGIIRASVTLQPDRPDGGAYGVGMLRPTGVWIRATGRGVGSLRVYAAYADGLAALDATRETEALLGEFSSPMTDRLLTVPVWAGACDAVTLRLEMTGEWIIHDVIRRYEIVEA